MNKKGIVGTTSVGILSSLFAFLGVVSCCGLPLIAGALAWLGIGASQLNFFAEYRPVFIGVSVVALLFGFWQVDFRGKSSCCSSSSCCGAGKNEQLPRSQRFQKVCLWVGAVLIALILILEESNDSSSQAELPETPVFSVPHKASGCCPQ